jgi:Ca2+-binding RTX toxin-like protein
MAITIGTSGSDHIGGTGGNDALAGGGGVDYMYGGAGNDAFVIKLSDFDPALNSAAGGPGAKTQDFIYDFNGAGSWNGTNNDFLYLQGFGAGSTISFQGYGQAGGVVDTHAQYYTIHSTLTGLDYTIAVGSTNGQQLVLGDYNFYS